MSIEAYTTIMTYFYVGLFLLSILTGIVAIWMRIRKKPLKFSWVIPCSILYSIFAFTGTATAYIAYDDIADPNYWLFKNWKLQDFIFNDIKMLIIWLFIGALVYWAFGRKERKRSTKIGFAAVVIVLIILFVAFTLVSSTGIS